MIVAASYGATPESARERTAVRQAFPYRLAGSVVEMLLPAARARVATIDGERRWVPTEDLPELEVEAAPVG